MKTTRTRNVFTFSELSPDAQEKATELLCAAAWENLDSDMISEYLAGHFAYLADGNDCGIMSVKELADKYRVRIYWSVSYSQSDDAQIDGVLSRDYHPNLAWPDGIHTIRVTARNMGWSSVSNVYMLDADGQPGSETWDSDIIHVAYQFVMELCQQLYRAARTECEHATSKEYVLETYADYFGLTRRFTADGDNAPFEFWSDDEVSA
jgi:hypothetical protein